MKFKSPNFATIGLLALIWLTAGSSLEFYFGSVALSPELLLATIAGAVFAMLSLLKNLAVSHRWVAICCTTFLIASLHLSDALLTGNKGALYGINFLLLTVTMLTLPHWISAANWKGSSLALLTFLALGAATIFYSNQGSGWETWDTFARSDGSVQQRLGVYGFVSNTLACILLLFIAYGFSRSEHGAMAHLTYTAPSVYWLAQTGSRTGMIVLMTLFGWEALVNRKYRKWLLPLVVVALTLLALLNIDDVTGFYQRLVGTGRGIFQTSRFTNWSVLIDDYSSGGVFTLLYGGGFFRDATDNTTLGILIGSGLVGLGTYFALGYFVFLTTTLGAVRSRRNIYQIWTVLIAFSMTMDFYAQRKIIIIAALLIGYIKANEKKDNYS